MALAHRDAFPVCMYDSATNCLVSSSGSCCPLALTYSLTCRFHVGYLVAEPSNGLGVETMVRKDTIGAAGLAMVF